jgi:hypothetical protein
MALNLAENSAKNRAGISNRLTVPEYLVVDRTEPEKTSAPASIGGCLRCFLPLSPFPKFAASTIMPPTP